MKSKNIQRLFAVAFLSGILSLIWLIVNEVFLIDIYWSMVFWQKPDPGSAIEVSIILGMIFSGLFHVLALIALILYAHFIKTMRTIVWLIIGIGIISLILLMGSVGLLHDIGNEYEVFKGVPKEWDVLFIVHFIHAIFYILVLGFLGSTIPKFSKIGEDGFIWDDRVFLLAHYVGLLTSLMGLSITILNLALKIDPELIRQGLPMMTIVILLPYCLMVVYWIIINRKKSIENWYDEKQWQDLGKSALMTGVILFPLGLIFYFLTFWSRQALAGVTWLPLMLFLCLMIFSGVNLILAKR